MKTPVRFACARYAHGMTNLNEYYIISNQMQLLERQIAEADNALKPLLYAAREAFLPSYLKLLGN